MTGKDIPPPFAFAANEYLAAERDFAFEAIGEIARRSSPLLSRIATESTESAVLSQITTDDGQTVEIEGVALKSTVELSVEEIVAGRPAPLLSQLSAAGEERAGVLVRYLVDSLARITEATGNTASAEGRSFFDAMMEMLEKTDLRFDEDGKLEQVLLMHPETAEKLRALQETPEQLTALSALLERKRREFDAGKRCRRLS
jgi:hypothetical protein